MRYTQGYYNVNITHTSIILIEESVIGDPPLQINVTPENFGLSLGVNNVNTSTIFSISSYEELNNILTDFNNKYIFIKLICCCNGKSSYLFIFEGGVNV